MKTFLLFTFYLPGYQVRSTIFKRSSYYLSKKNCDNNTFSGCLKLLNDLQCFIFYNVYYFFKFVKYNTAYVFK